MKKAPNIIEKPKKVSSKDKGFKNDTREYALSLWKSGKPIDSTLAETYLSSRNIVDFTQKAKEKLRYSSAVKHAPSNDYYPCLLIKIQQYSGLFAGCLRIYLDRNGKGKAPVSPRFC